MYTYTVFDDPQPKNIKYLCTKINVIFYDNNTWEKSNKYNNMMYLWVKTRIRWFSLALFFCKNSSSRRTLNSFSFKFFLEISTCCCFFLFVINRIQIYISIKIIQHFSPKWQVFIFFVTYWFSVCWTYFQDVQNIIQQIITNIE